MFEFVPLVLALVLADLYPLGGEPVWYSPWITLGATAAVTLGLGLLARRAVRRAGFRLEAHADLVRYAIEIHRIQLGLRALLLGAFAAQVYLLHWPLFLWHTLGLDGILVLDRLAVLLPVLAGLVLFWIAAYPVDLRLRGSTWTLREFLEFRARTSAGTVLAPILLLSGAIEGLVRLPAIERWIAIWPHVEWLVYAGSVFLLYSFAGVLLRLVWNAQPLPRGPLRASLEEVQRRAGFRCRDLLVWRTGGGRIANALVIGLAAPLRYVIFTDTLLERLSPAEVGAVFGHEIGHARHHHLAWYFGFSLCLVLVLTWVQLTLGPFLSPALLGGTISDVAQGALTLLVLAAMAMAFGCVSRRFERQADITGAELTGDPEGFVIALEKIGAMNGIPRRMKSWRYFSLEQRMQDVRAAAASAGTLARFHGSARRVMIALLGFYLLSMAGAVQVAASQRDTAVDRLREYRGRTLARAAWQSLQENKLSLARAQIEAALVESSSRAEFHVLYGEILFRQGEFGAGNEAFRWAARLQTANPWARIRLAEENGK